MFFSKKIKNLILYLYINKKLSTRKISEKLNIGRKVVIRCLKENQVKFRTISEANKEFYARK